MGFPPELLLSSEEHSCEFICAICVQLVDYESASMLKCSHVFCSACLDEWFNGPSASRSCPMCNAHVLQASLIPNSDPFAAPLRQCNPLAHRVLSRIRVRCPLYKQDCSWEGDYSEVHGHLTSTTAHVANGGDSEDLSVPMADAPCADADAVADGSQPKKAKRQSSTDVALALKEQANVQFENRNFAEAIKLYTKAISVDNNLPVLFANRAAAHSMTENLRASIDDCDCAINIDPKYFKAYRRKAKALADLGLLNEAMATLRSGIMAVQGDDKCASALKAMKTELVTFESVVAAISSAQAYMANGNYSEAVQLLGQTLQHTSADNIVLLRARAELGCGIVDGAKRVSLAILRKDRNNVQAYATRAMALYLSGESDDAIRLARQALKMDPDDVYAKNVHKKGKFYGAQMDRIKTAIEQRDFETVVQVSSQLLDSSIPHKAPIFAAIHAERANAFYRLGRHEESLKDCGIAIYTQEDCKRAWLTKRWVCDACSSRVCLVCRKLFRTWLNRTVPNCMRLILVYQDCVLYFGEVLSQWVHSLCDSCALILLQSTTGWRCMP
eukprot:m.33255 g.33255  ORF g.33255 m.33255 type:complete len:557 (-) comp14219_c0_seq2:1183-2853(-)